MSPFSENRWPAPDAETAFRNAARLPLGFGVSGALVAPFFPAARTRELVRGAFELGVRFFDTAPTYGAGAAERRLGEALADLPRDEILLATKAGFGAGHARNFAPDAVLRSVEASLHRLRVDHIDILFLHGPAPHEITDDLFAMLTTLRAEGRIRAIGVTGRGAEMDTAFATGEIRHVMAPLNAHSPAEDRERLARFRAAGAHVIAIEALRPALARQRTLSSVGGVWRLAKGLLRGDLPGEPAASQSVLTAREALCWSLGPGEADLVLTTTTRRTRLRANADAARRAALSPPTAPAATPAQASA